MNKQKWYDVLTLNLFSRLVVFWLIKHSFEKKKKKKKKKERGGGGEGEGK